MIWVDGWTEISDQFLWPKRQRDVKNMKIFAIDYLSDILGAKNIQYYLPSHVTGFANYVAYMINREIDVATHFDQFSIESMVKDGTFGYGSGLGFGEHIVQINLAFGDLRDQLEWDVSNPDNLPEDFAITLIRDLGLSPELDYFRAISYEIRKQITLHCCRKVQTFVSFYENYVAQEVEALENLRADLSREELAPSSHLFPASVRQEQVDDKTELKRILQVNGGVGTEELIFNQGRFVDRIPKPLDLAPSEQKEVETDSEPEFLKLDQNLKKTPEQEEILEAVMYAEIALRHESFQPQALAPQRKVQ